MNKEELKIAMKYQDAVKREKERLEKEQLILLGISPDGICIEEGCNASLMAGSRQERKARCKEHQESRKDYFKRKHYEAMGWDTSKLKGE